MLQAGPLVISEFLAIHDGDYVDLDATPPVLPYDDEDGDLSDWIEIHNPSDAAVSLDGWYLTDDQDDLTKWAFPARSLTAGNYLVVFASGKDRRDAGELHTNFQLDGDGEYLALVGPDGAGDVEVAYDFFPEFPQQRGDVSYGPANNADAFTLEASGLTYLVPQSGDAPLGTTWTAPGFDDSAWDSFVQPPQVLVTEAGTGDDFVEIQNLSGETVDTSGWVVAVNNASGRTPNINNLNTLVWELPGSMARDEVLYRHDIEADPEHYWGENIFFRTASVGWVVIVDNAGNIVDFVVWGYTPAEVASLAVTVNGFDVTAAGVWLGDSVASSTADKPSLQRQGGADHDDASNWEFVTTTSQGASNDDLAVPFSGRAAPSIGFEANPPGLEGEVLVDVADVMHEINSSIWTRIPFEIEHLAELETVELRMKYNDGFVAYLNGQPVAERNAPASPGWDAAALQPRSIQDSLQFESIDLSPYMDVMQTGTNLLAIHGLSASAADDNFLIHPELAGTNRQYFDTPTPEGPNGSGFRGFVEDTRFSVDRGFYEEPIEVAISTDTPGAKIYYTLDGSEPYLDLDGEDPDETNGMEYTGPLAFSSTTMLRAAAFRPRYAPSNVDTHTYIFLDDVYHQDGAGLPDTWGVYIYDNVGQPRPANYEVDPDVVNDPRYHGTLKDDLRSIPTMSLVLDPEDLWSSTTGIYSNTTQSGVAWERAASVELIGVDGRTEFQVDAGVRIHGGWGRRPWQNSKHSFRLLFKRDYGPARLEYPLFGDGAAGDFDTLVLRAGFNDSWRTSSANNTYLYDRWAAEAQLDMDGLAPHGTWVHLYLNGLYWGLYNPVERPNAAFAASYLGGEKEDYDAIVTRQLIDGDLTSWNQLLNLVRAGSINYDAVKQLLDVPAFLDYLMVNQWGANWDWPQNNWYATHERSPEGKWRFHSWDAEGVMMRNVSDNRVNNYGDNGPGEIYEELRGVPEFRMEFADRVHRNMFNDGQLTPAANRARLDRIAAAVDRAIVGESARWGDGRRNEYSPCKRDEHWIPRLNTLRTSYIPQRTGIVVGQYRAAGLYPAIHAPELNQHGGELEPGFRMSLQNLNGSGTIYYMLDGSDPRVPGGGLRSGAMVYSSPVTLTEGTIVKARVRDGNEWSALTEAKFFINRPATAENLVITELNYNPYDPTEDEQAADFTDNDDFEFLELCNTSSETVYLGDVRFTAGIDFEFNDGPVETLAAGQRLVVARNPAAFQFRYGTGVNVTGGYDTLLDNNGERIALVDRLGQPIFGFRYDDGGNWPGRADGNGSSLELIDPALVPVNEALRTTFLENDDHWRSSSEYGGSPGVAGEGPRGDVVINEVLTHTDWPDYDAIELHNTTAATINIGGWYLSDSNTYRKFRVPGGTTIPAGGYRVFDEDDFNPTPMNPGPGDFALDGAHGDDVWLLQAESDGTLTRFVDHVEFGASANGESFGRWPNGSGELYPMQLPTLNPQQGDNSGPRVGPVILSEVMYNPANVVGADELEFIEIYNPTGQTVDLTNWRIRRGIDFDFPANTLLPSSAALLVVSFDPADAGKVDAFYDHYGIDAPVPMVGPYVGVLDNGGERAQLQRPDAPPADEPTFIPRLLEDEIRYDDVSPWPIEADGSGKSLSRASEDAWGHDSASWIAASPTPGTVLPSGEAQVVGRYVFYNNSSFGPDDDAIAPDKTALLPGETAGFANYTSYALGLNGVMVDIAGLPDGAALDTNDFEFRVGNDDDPAGWVVAPTPSAITIRPTDGLGGSARVTITWNDYAMTGQWLQVTVLDTQNTDLPLPDVFYFGNAVGETGDVATDARVNAADVLLTRNNPRTFLTPAPIDFPCDFNRDGRVNATDLLIARSNQTHLLDALKLIAVPAQGAILKQTVGQDSASAENFPARIDWLFALEGIQSQDRPLKESNSSEETVEGLLQSWRG